MPSVVAKVASAARTVTGESGPLRVGQPLGAAWSKLALLVDVTAVGTDANETLDLDVEWLVDASLTELGDPAYDEAGGGIADEWTLVAHGLYVGTRVEFTASSTGATGYAIDTPYYVAEVPDADTFSLSATYGGTAIAGTTDAPTGWTLAQYGTFHPASTADDFTQILQTAGRQQVVSQFDVKGDQYRVIWTLGGTTPSFTFEIHEHVV